MRPLFAIIIAVCILGGVKLFIDSEPTRDTRDHVHFQADQSTKNYDVELTLTFDAGPDEFSLSSDGDAPSVLLQLNGKEVLKRTDTVAATDSPIVLQNVDGVTVGINEFYVQASPTEDDLKPRSLRIRILQGGNVVAEEALWPEASAIVQGTVSMEVSQ